MSYGYPFAVLRTRPLARWMAAYDELYAGLTSPPDALSRDAASIVLLESWGAIVAEIRRDARNARRRARYAERQAEWGHPKGKQ
jgi:hypothetical protein